MSHTHTPIDDVSNIRTKSQIFYLIFLLHLFFFFYSNSKADKFISPPNQKLCIQRKTVQKSIEIEMLQMFLL